jgi:hypothetical protein
LSPKWWYSAPRVPTPEAATISSVAVLKYPFFTNRRRAAPINVARVASACAARDVLAAGADER